MFVNLPEQGTDTVMLLSNVSTYGTDLQGLIREEFGLIVTAKK